MISVELSNRQDDLHFDASQLTSRLADLLAEEGYASGELSVSVVGETEMHALNRQFLDHDYHTDVLSFVLERDDNRLQGEIIASAAMAMRASKGCMSEKPGATHMPANPVKTTRLMTLGLSRA